MKPILKLSIIVIMALTFSSCSSEVVSQNSKGTIKNNVQPVQIQTVAKVPDTKEIVTSLCSDEFQGRLVGSEGNEMAGEYIENIFKNVGLDPYFDGSYYQKYYQVINSTGDRNGTKLKMVNNVVGFIKGKNSDNAVVISAHFDHLGYVDGKIIRGALDNASGVSALIEVAHTLKEKSKEEPFDMDIIFCAFNGEETGCTGSREFANQINGMYLSMYDINIDCIGAKSGGKNLALKNNSKISNRLYQSIEATFKKDNISFADKAVHGLSDQLSFETLYNPNVFIVQENIENLVHKPTDTPDTLDYEQIDKIANAISDFVETNNGVNFSLIN